MSRRTTAGHKIAAAILAADAPMFGYDLSRKAKVRSGAMYPVLDRMLAAGWLIDGWEDASVRRRPRRFYVLTELGRHELAARSIDAGIR